jgi:hypothetical protein
MIEYKLLSGSLKQTLIRGDYQMTLEVVEDNMIFVEIRHMAGEFSASVSEVMEKRFGFDYYVEYGDTVLSYYSAQELPVGNILMDSIYVMSNIIKM